jgi:hypothetical protein
MKLTEWYDPDQKPVRKGYYECKCCNFKFYWDGKGWLSKKDRKDYAQMAAGWRGLAKKRVRNE